MSTFVLLLHEEPVDFANVTMDEIQAMIDEYSTWRERLVAANRYVGGFKLKDEGGRHLRLQDGQLSAAIGPYAEAKEVLGGYFVIRAADYDEAADVSRSCPHLKYGGRIEIRQVDEFER